MCLLHPVFLRYVLSDVIDVISEYSADSALYLIVKAILPRLTTCVFSKAENLERFYDPPGM